MHSQGERTQSVSFSPLVFGKILKGCNPTQEGSFSSVGGGEHQHTGSEIMS